MSIRAQLRLASRAIMTFTSHFPRHCISPSARTLSAGRGGALLTPPSFLSISIPDRDPSPLRHLPHISRRRRDADDGQQHMRASAESPTHLVLTTNVSCDVGYPFSWYEGTEDRGVTGGCTLTPHGPTTNSR